MDLPHLQWYKMSQLNNQSVLKFNPNILKRFELNVNSGTLFLFDSETNNLWTGNSAANEILKLVDGINCVAQIYVQAEKLYAYTDVDDLKNSINILFAELLNKNFLVKI